MAQPAHGPEDRERGQWGTGAGTGWAARNRCPAPRYRPADHDHYRAGGYFVGLP